MAAGHPSAFDDEILMSTETTPNFDVCSADLMRPTLLEASAGTGKTFSIKHLVLRLVVEKAVEIDKILVVTFTRAATAELRGRIRDHLSEALGFLEGQLQVDEVDGVLPSQCDRWASMVDESGEGFVLDAAPARLRRALSAFDNAAVFTIHSFCQKALGAHAFTAAGNFDFELADSEDEILDDVVEDFLRRELDRHAQEPELRRAIMEAKDWAEKLKTLVKLPEDLAEREILTSDASEFDSELAETLGRFVKEAPPEVARRRREAHVATFDDLIVNLQQALTREEDEGGHSLRDALRESYRAALIDEFQDTDPLQFDIIDRLFLRAAEAGDAGRRAIFLVGDPKQAIYRFRDADLNTYLDARDRIRSMATGVVAKLGKNYRSTPKLVEALNAFYRTAEPDLGPFLDADLRYEPVEAHDKNSGLFWKGADGTWVEAPPMEVWTHLGEGSSKNVVELRKLCADLCAQDAVEILEASVAGKAGVAAEEGALESEIVGETEWKGARIRLRRVQPSDFAVLIENRNVLDPYLEAFAKRGIRVRYQSSDSVFSTPEALDMVRILRAFSRPGEERVMRAARATRLVGDTLAMLSKDDETRRIHLREFFDDGLAKWRRSGVASAFSGLMEACRTVERLLPVEGGERVLTNYDHLIEILHSEGRRHRTPEALLAWFEREVAKGSAGDGKNLRLESDDNLVTISTIHSSKGLQYPIVYLAPFANRRKTDRSTYRIHERGRPMRILISHLAASWPSWENDESLRERIRVLYVALTRAEKRLVVCAPQKKKDSGWNVDTASTPFFLALTGIKEAKKPTQDEILAAVARLQALEGEKPRFRELDEMTVLPPHVAHLSAPRETLSARASRNRRPAWSTSSFTAIARMASEDGDAAAPRYAEAKPETRPHEHDILDFPKGPQAGSALHRILELADFARLAGNDLKSKAARESLCRRTLPHYLALGETDLEEAALAAAAMLEDVFNAEILPGFALKRLPRGARRAEVEFLIPTGSNARAADLSRLLGMLSPEAEVPDLSDESLKGYLTGFIDLLFMHEGRFWVLDWKSNAVSEVPEGFDGMRLDEEMRRHRYRLQYLIYLTALRRMLKLRFGEAEAESRIGGAIYLFLRGVRAGSTTAANPQGVVCERVHPAVLRALDEFFEKGFSLDAVERAKREVEGEEA